MVPDCVFACLPACATVQDGKEWGFWYLWFTSVGLLRLLTNVAKQHFEHVSGVGSAC